METQSAFMAAAAAAVLVAAVLVRLRDRAGLLLGALVTSFGLWALGRGLAALGHPFGTEIEGAALAVAGPLTLAFAWILGAPVPSPRSVLPTLGLAGLCVAGLQFVRGPWSPIVEPLPVASCGVLVTTAAVLLVRRRVPPSTEYSPELTRLRYVATSHALVVLAVAADVGLGLLNAPRGATYFAGLFYLYMSYLHLARVRVVDLRQLLGNTLALGLLATGLVTLFAGLHLWVGARLDLFVLNAFLASFVLLLFFDPIRRGVQHATDRWWVGAKIALERSLSPLGSRLSQVLTLDELLREFLHTLERTERVTSSSIFLRDDPHMGFQLAASIGLSPRPRVNLIREPAFVRALQRGEVLITEDLERVEPGERFPIPAEERAVLLRSAREVDAQVIIPLRAGSNVVGFWTLTEARAAEAFSTEEVRLLRDLAARAAISIENSKTFERIRARDRLVALGEMAGGLAHEIRNPIATIRAGLDLLERPGEEDPTEIRHLIVEEVHRLDRVVGLFLDYARPSPSCKTPQDVVKVLERSVGSARLRYPGSPVEVGLHTDEDLPPMPLDGPRLERIVSNLVRNASEACEPGGSVLVTAQTDRTPEGEVQGLEIIVEDEGCGMSDATLSRAFLPFFTTKERGVGLGLALCERLVRGQGGEIELRSEPGRGTRARVWLPVSTSPATEPDEESGP